jgi:hypothetical protein
MAQTSVNPRTKFRESLTNALIGKTPAGSRVYVYTAEGSTGFDDLPVVLINPANQQSDRSNNQAERTMAFTVTGLIKGLDSGEGFARCLEEMEWCITQAIMSIRGECSVKSIEKNEIVYSDQGQQSVAGIRIFVKFNYRQDY